MERLLKRLVLEKFLIEETHRSESEFAYGAITSVLRVRMEALAAPALLGADLAATSASKANPTDRLLLLWRSHGTPSFLPVGFRKPIPKDGT